MGLSSENIRSALYSSAIHQTGEEMARVESVQGWNYGNKSRVPST